MQRDEQRALEALKNAKLLTKNMNDVSFHSSKLSKTLMLLNESILTLDKSINQLINKDVK